MAYKGRLQGKGWLDLAEDQASRIVEQGIAALLQKNEYTDTITNLASFCLEGGELMGNKCREWVFSEDLTTGTMELIGTRNYSSRRGQKPLESAEKELIFDEHGRLAKYRTGDPGLDPSRACPDRLSETLGLLKGISGGILPGKRGGFGKNVQDITEIRKIAAQVAIEHYTERALNPSTRKYIGKDPSGRKNLYTVEIPVSESHFKLFNPAAYDLALGGDYIKLGTCHFILESLGYGAVKKLIERIGAEGEPIEEAHTMGAYRLAQSPFGDFALASYPAVAMAYTGGKLAKDCLYRGWKFKGKNQTTQ